MSIASRLFVLAAAAVMVLTVAPPAAGDPARKPRSGQLVAVAGVEQPGYSGDGGDARQAHLGPRPDVAVAANGVLYVADPLNEVLRAIGTDGVINTVPGVDDPTDDLNYPVSVATDVAGVLYVGLLNNVLRMNSDGTFTVIAGGGDKSFGPDGDGDGGNGGPATEARLDILDIAIGPDGSVYLLDGHDHRIRRVGPDGTISTVTTWTATRTPRNGASSIAVDPGGTVYFTDAEVRAVQKVAPDGAVSTVLGQRKPGFAGDGGLATEALFGEVGGIATDADGNVYVVDTVNSNIRVIDKKGVINTVGPFVPELSDVAVAPNGDLYLTVGAQIKKLVPGQPEVPPAGGKTLEPGPARRTDQEPGTVIPIAGNSRRMTEAQRHRAEGDAMAVGPDGTVFTTNTLDDLVLAIGPDGKQRRYAGSGRHDGNSGDNGVATQADLGSVTALATDRAGNLYISDTFGNRILEVDTNGKITTIAGTGDGLPPAPEGPLGDGGPATAAAVDAQYLATGPDGSLYIADRAGHGRLRKIDPNGVISTIVGGGGKSFGETTSPAEVSLAGAPTSLVVDLGGNVYFTYDRRLYVLSGGTVSLVAKGNGFAGDGGPAEQALLNNPGGLAVGTDGSRYVADTYNNRVRAIRPDGTIATVAGTGKRVDDGDGGRASAASLVEPNRVATDAAGNIYVTTAEGRRIRRIDTTGVITTLAEFGLVVDGPAMEMVVDKPISVDVDPAGTAYVVGDTPPMAVTTDGKVHAVADIPFEDRGVVGSLAAGGDGSVYLIRDGRVDRIYPDGATVTVAGGAANPHGENELTKDLDGKRATGVVIDPSDVAIGPSGELYLACGAVVYRLAEDGTLKSIVDIRKVDGRENPTLALAVSGDGEIYVADDVSDRVYAVNKSGEARVFAGDGTDIVDDYRGDGNDAEDAPLGSPTDVAVAPDGTVYIATSGGVRRVSTDGEIDTVVEPLTNGRDRGGEPESLAVDTHGNLYLTAADRNRLYVVVSPLRQSTQPFSWSYVWLGISVVVLAAASYGVIRRRRNPRPVRQLRTTPIFGGSADTITAADPAEPTTAEGASEDDSR